MLTVIGSINMDLVTVTNHNPSMGETVMGEKFFTIPGGKGANQAVAAAKLGQQVKMIGKVGGDIFGREYLDYLKTLNINIDKISIEQSEKTGTASITVYQNDNKIIVVPGANHLMTPEVIAAHRDDILASSWLLLQLEIPLPSVEKALEIAAQGKVNVILNPAPFAHIPAQWMEKITYLTPNEYEAEQLITSYQGDEQTMKMLRDKLVITKGEAGAEIFIDGKTISIPAMKVEAVDTTGAGDTFNGALAVALSEGKPLQEATAFAITAAGLSVTKLGAQSGMPDRQAVERLIAE